MDANALRNRLAELKVTPPVDPETGADIGAVLRTSLYLAQIEAVHTLLFTTLASDLGKFYDRFKGALQDPQLLNGFCAVLDSFVGAAINTDMLAKAASFNSYANYFDVVVFQGNYDHNVAAFFTSYPATERAVQALTTNFSDNITTACTRIQLNWNEISKTFAPSNGQITHLLRIKSTGSDFHKGGQQVLILTFQLFLAISDNMGDVHPMNDTLQVIYKPADVEIDCLIAGDSAAVNAVHAGFQTESLFEIVNTLIAAERRTNPRLQDLPTYKILPYAWGSSLARVVGRLPIRTSYGYIQFLEQSHAPGRNVWNYYPFGSSDFKIFPNDDAIGITRRFYQTIGELLAVCSTFSICDMHLENLIVSRYRPYLIDLEVSLTRSVTDVGQMEFFGSTGSITGLQTQSSALFWSADGKRLKANFPYPEEQQNRLYTMRPDKVVSPNAPVAAAALLRGFDDAFGLLEQAASQHRFDNWFIRVNLGVVARYIPFKTTDYRNVMTDIYLGSESANLDYYQTRILGLLTQKYVTNPPTPNADPEFLAAQEYYIGTDYENCDIPSFYYQVNAQNLQIMDSAGDALPIPQTIDIIDVNNKPHTHAVPVLVPLGRATYFSAAPTAALQANQVNNLAAQPAARATSLYNTLKLELGVNAIPDDSGGVIHAEANAS
jgi:hypothetical protein